MKPQQSITKVQAALLGAAHAASLMLGTPGTVPARFLYKLTSHYFRANLVANAIRELQRGRLASHEDDNDSVSIRKPASLIGLVGCDPTPLSDDQLVSMLESAGFLKPGIAQQPIPARNADSGCSVSASHTNRRRLLADHHLAERWYRGDLPSDLSRRVIVLAPLRPQSAISIRAGLEAEGLMRCETEPTMPRLAFWGVTRHGIQYYGDTKPTMTPLEIEAFASTLGFIPIENSDHPGR